MHRMKRTGCIRQLAKEQQQQLVEFATIMNPRSHQEKQADEEVIAQTFLPFSLFNQCIN